MTLRHPILLGLATLLTACGPGEAGPPVKWVILITCDTLRADRLGAYGYERGVSPELDAFAREGLVFQEAYASAPMTQPAVSTLLTGLLPEEIGVVPGNVRKLPAEVQTLAETLSEAGVATAAVVSNWVLLSPPQSGEGVRQGFEHFDGRMTVREKNRAMYERLAPDTTDAAIDWLVARDAEGDDRFFLWVHYQDPHGPYTPPADIAARFARQPQDAPRVPLGATKLGEGQIPRYQVLEGEQRPGVYEDRYDAEIFFFDRELGRLLDHLRREGLYEDALIIFTADHGESLGEKDFWFCHGENVQREVVRVPLIIRYPEKAPRPASEREDGYRRCRRVVGHVDAAPTILEAFGLPGALPWGVSWLSRELPELRLVRQSLEHNPKEGRKKWWGLSDGRYRLVQSDADAKPRLYDIREDPRETRDLAAELPAEVRRMLDGWELLARDVERLNGQDAELTAEEREALIGLGYVDEDEE